MGRRRITNLPFLLNGRYVVNREDGRGGSLLRRGSGTRANDRCDRCEMQREASLVVAAVGKKGAAACCRRGYSEGFA